jgi:dihydropteroate synthase
MGILNITADSFYDGGKYTSQKSMVEHTAKMLSEGATLIDVGAMSSRPGAQEIPLKEELEILLPSIHRLRKEFPEILISVDTYRSEIARAILDNGACIINDITAGLHDPEMLAIIGRYQVPYVMMHMQGMPSTMQQQPRYDDITLDLIKFFSERVKAARELGINDLIIDVGFGFGKTVSHNYALLDHLGQFQIFDIPLLVGMSRKSMLYKPLEITAGQALNATTAAHTVALMKGATILRVHDVREAMEAIEITELTKGRS